MGNQLSAHPLKQSASPGEFLAEVPQVTYKGTLGGGRFLKTVFGPPYSRRFSEFHRDYVTLHGVTCSVVSFWSALRVAYCRIQGVSTG